MEFPYPPAATCSPVPFAFPLAPLLTHVTLQPQQRCRCSRLVGHCWEPTKLRKISTHLTPAAARSPAPFTFSLSHFTNSCYLRNLRHLQPQQRHRCSALVGTVWATLRACNGTKLFHSPSLVLIHLLLSLLLLHLFTSSCYRNQGALSQQRCRCSTPKAQLWYQASYGLWQVYCS